MTRKIFIKRNLFSHYGFRKASPATMKPTRGSHGCQTTPEKACYSSGLICCAPVAQLDRVPGYEPGGRGFESCRARQSIRLFFLLSPPRGFTRHAVASNPLASSLRHRGCHFAIVAEPSSFRYPCQSGPIEPFLPASRRRGLSLYAENNLVAPANRSPCTNESRRSRETRC
jgi:hypothetical protein